MALLQNAVVTSTADHSAVASLFKSIDTSDTPVICSSLSVSSPHLLGTSRTFVWVSGMGGINHS